MSKIYSFYGGGYVAVTEVNGKIMKAEFTDIVDAAKWIKQVESTEVKEDEENNSYSFDNSDSLIDCGK